MKSNFKNLFRILILIVIFICSNTDGYSGCTFHFYSIEHSDNTQKDEIKIGSDADSSHEDLTDNNMNSYIISDFISVTPSLNNISAYHYFRNSVWQPPKQN